MITILAAGSRGDTQPFLALGVALKQSGHEVRITSHKNNESLIKGLGLELFPLEGDIAQIISSQVGVEAMQADNPLKLLRSFNTLKSFVYDRQIEFFNACQGSEAIIFHPGAAIGYFVAHEMNIPGILGTPFPMTPTRQYPSIIVYDSPRLGGSYNLLSHKVFERIMWSATSAPTKEFWKKQFGSAPRNFSCPYSKVNPVLVSCSNHVFPRPADWPEHVHQSGYWFLDDEPGWEPPRDLMDFLEAGEPPVYVGFGSLGEHAEADKTTRLVLEALDRAGMRGVLATGLFGLSRDMALPANTFRLESAPHAWLFPRMAAVVHHGGAGTTAAGLRAGVPSVIITYGNDTLAWGRRVYELGVGPKPLPRKKLTVEQLAAALVESRTESMITAAAELGKKIRTENGALDAAKVICRIIE
jgi:sterol 3beta-glucosyltransferase